MVMGMYTIKALSIIDDIFNDTIIINDYKLFNQYCTNSAYNYYLYKNDVIIDEILNN